MRAGAQHFGDLAEARFDAAAVTPRKGGQQAADIFAGALGASMELAGAREAMGGFQRARDEFHELAVRFGAKCHEF
jgi:hypothetical protein